MFDSCLLDACSFLQGNWEGVYLSERWSGELGVKEGVETVLGLCFIKEEPIFNLKNNWEKNEV